MSSERYNGFTNYETWCVSLWLSNDERVYRYWRDVRDGLAAIGRGLARSQPDGCFGMRHWVKSELSERLQDEISSDIEVLDLLQRPSMAADLLTHALGRVDWLEIAENMLEE